MTTTVIHNNGSHWASEEPDTIEQLIEVLGKEPLDRARFRRFIVHEPSGKTSFFGNFLLVSHVFNITTDDPDVIKKLTVAIHRNQQRPDYKSQPKYQRRVSRLTHSKPYLARYGVD